MTAELKKVENGSTDLCAALKKVTKKSTAARVVLDTFGMPPGEAVPALLDAWRILASALSMLESALEKKEKKLGELDSERLRTVKTQIESRTTALSALNAAPTDRREIPFSRKEGLRDTMALATAVRTLKRVWRTHLASAGYRKLYAASLGGIVLLSAATLALLGVGLYFAWTYPGLDEGLLATYFTKNGFRGVQFVVVDHQINFSWGDEQPLKGVGPDDFSVIWEGCLIVDKGTNARLIAGADEGIRVFIENDKIIDDWAPHSFRRKEANRTLSPGIYPIKVEYFENRGDAQVFLGWSLDGADMKVIPFENLVPKTTGPGFGSRNARCPARARKF